jgi:hypothetical protein
MDSQIVKKRRRNCKKNTPSSTSPTVPHVPTAPTTAGISPRRRRLGMMSRKPILLSTEKVWLTEETRPSLS